MKALLALLVAVASLISLGCGTDSEGSGAPTTEPAASEPTAVAEPSEPPPKLDVEGPPPAWIETGEGSFWLAYSTFCWKTACASYGPPTCNDAYVPRLAVDTEEEVRFHLGFRPKTVRVAFFRGGKPAEKEIELEAGREPVWAVHWAGPFVLGVTSRDGLDASYAACVRSPAGTASSAAPVPGGALTVEEAIAFGASEPVVVKGTVIAPEREPPRLCQVVLLSDPPQCGEPSLVLRGVDLRTLSALETDGGVSFTNRQVILLGRVEGTVLAVSSTTIASASG